MKTIFELGAPGRRGFQLPEQGLFTQDLAGLLGTENLRRSPLDLPECAEIEVVRHFSALARLNYGVDDGFYPLGSCTMKYNPKINEVLAALPGFTAAHPMAKPEDAQGSLALLYQLEEALCRICGMEAFSLAPAAGAHGELTGLMVMAAYHQRNGQTQRNLILIPDSAHGTNPASAALCGFQVKAVPSDERGLVSMPALREAVAAAGETLAGLMLTCPNTLGLFEESVMEISEEIHNAGGLVYYDGANLNAIMGATTPGILGFDVVHVNLHKTFATPHGGGGPGAGPVGVKAHLAAFLPAPRVLKNGQACLSPTGDMLLPQDSDVFTFDASTPDSIGRVKAYYGNFGVLIKALGYILTLGGDGLRAASRTAVLNANYIKQRLETAGDVPFGQTCLHEFVLSAGKLRDETGISAMDIAKALIDRGYHPPTVYFPLIVREALMIEPTETETRETLDGFIEAMLDILTLAKSDPEAVKASPVKAPVSRPDDAQAARSPILKVKPWAERV